MRFLVKIPLYFLYGIRMFIYYFCRFFQINDFMLDFPDGDLWLDMFLRRTINAFYKDFKSFGLIK